MERKSASVLAMVLLLSFILTFSVIAGCTKEPPEDAVFTLNWEADQGTWSVEDQNVNMKVMVKNESPGDLWLKIMHFENDCFRCKGFGEWTSGWENRGKIPADGNQHEISIVFEPRGVCQPAEYFFYIEGVQDPKLNDSVAKFNTALENHRGSKKFRVAIASK